MGEANSELSLQKMHDIRALLISTLLLALGCLPALTARAQEVGDPWERAAEESFWYSLYNVESLLLHSGMGAPLGPEELARAGLAPSELSGLFPLVAPFRLGLPEFAVRPQADRPGTFRWQVRAADPTISLEALAFSVLVELGWAARLEQLLRSQSDSFALEREARLLRAMARAAAEFAERKLLRPDGLYHNALRWWRDLPLAEGPPPWRTQLAWLWALASLAPQDPQALARADALYAALSRNLPWEALSVPDTSLAIKALAGYLYALQRGGAPEERAAEVVRRIDALAERLAARPLPHSPDGLSLADLAAAVSGLLYAYQLTDEGRYRRAAEGAWKQLMRYWRDDLELFLAIPPESDGEIELHVEELAELLSAFHTMIYAAESEEVREEARGLYARFFEGLKRSGLQRAEGPEAGGSYDGDPVPDVLDAGEPPVLIAAVRLDPGTQRWQVADRRFLTAPALHATLIWLWLGQFQGEGFVGPPPRGLPTSALARQLHLPRRLRSLERNLAELEGALLELQSRMEIVEEDLQAQGKSVDDRLRALEQKLLRRLNGELDALKEELSREPPPPVDEEALAQRLQERLEKRWAEALEPRLATLSEGLQRLEQKLNALGAPSEAESETIQKEIVRLKAELGNLMERVGALEERQARWPLRPEALLLAVVLLGLALLLVGVLHLLRLRLRRP